MKVIGIIGDLVEYFYSDDNEMCYMPLDEFITNFGKQTLYGDNINIVEQPNGTLYIC